MEQVREGDGLEGAFGKRDYHRASSRNFNVSMDEPFTLNMKLKSQCYSTGDPKRVLIIVMNH